MFSDEMYVKQMCIWTDDEEKYANMKIAGRICICKSKANYEGYKIHFGQWDSVNILICFTTSKNNHIFLVRHSWS